MPVTLPYYLVTVLLLLSSACGEEDCLDSSITLDEYIEQNELTVETDDDTGLDYIILEAGSSESPTLSDTVSVEFVGYTTDRDTFDQTTGSPRALLMNNLILGWQTGLQLIGEGGRIQLFVPSNLAYANNPVGPICANTDLIFEVELSEVR